jgi:predicted transcriptional regulator
MANLTVAIDDTLLRRAREVAVRENTSVNALVRDFLSRYVDARSKRLEALARFESVAASSESRSHEAWSRDSLHARP